MQQGFGFDSFIAYIILVFAWLGFVQAAIHAWRCLRRKRSKAGRVYIIGPKGDIRSMASNGATAALLRDIEEKQTA